MHLSIICVFMRSSRRPACHAVIIESLNVVSSDSVEFHELVRLRLQLLQAIWLIGCKFPQIYV